MESITIDPAAPVKQRIPRSTRIALIACAVVLVVGVSYFAYNRYYNDPQAKAEREAAQVVAAVGKLMELPTDEKPIIATVADPAQLANQPFFQVRGLRSRDIRERQLDVALAMQPDLVTLFAGTNDVVARAFDPAAVGADMETMHRALIGQSATLLTFTLPDLTLVLPMAKRLAPRVAALNNTIRAVSAGTGAVMVDFATYPMASDPRLWREDRFHANAEGHARIAAALAHAAGLPGFEAAWADDLPPAPPPTAGSKVVAEVRWVTRYLIPWLWRHAHGRSSGDGVGPKRPVLKPVEPAAANAAS